jgi:hypothetical protein
MSALTEKSPVDSPAVRRENEGVNPQTISKEASSRPETITDGGTSRPGLVRKGDFYLLDWDGPGDPGNPRK